MAATLRHFSINADDLQRSKAFYEKVFGWTITAAEWPDFFLISNPGEEPRGSLQGRHEMVEGRRTNAFVTSFAVDDIRATLAAVEAGGGKVLMRPSLIEGVGEVGYFEDTEGNVCGVAQYLTAAG